MRPSVGTRFTSFRKPSLNLQTLPTAFFCVCLVAPHFRLCQAKAASICHLLSSFLSNHRFLCLSSLFFTWHLHSDSKTDFYFLGRRKFLLPWMINRSFFALSVLSNPGHAIFTFCNNCNLACWMAEMTSTNDRLATSTLRQCLLTMRHGFGVFIKISFPVLKWQLKSMMMIFRRCFDLY